MWFPAVIQAERGRGDSKAAEGHSGRFVPLFKSESPPPSVLFFVQKKKKKKKSHYSIKVGFFFLPPIVQSQHAKRSIL